MALLPCSSEGLFNLQLKMGDGSHFLDILLGKTDFQTMGCNDDPHELTELTRYEPVNFHPLLSIVASDPLICGPGRYL